MKEPDRRGKGHGGGPSPGAAAGATPSGTSVRIRDIGHRHPMSPGHGRGTQNPQVRGTWSPRLAGEERGTTIRCRPGPRRVGSRDADPGPGGPDHRGGKRSNRPLRRPGAEGPAIFSTRPAPRRTPLILENQGHGNREQFRHRRSGTAWKGGRVTVPQLTESSPAPGGLRWSAGRLAGGNSLCQPPLLDRWGGWRWGAGPRGADAGCGGAGED